MVSVRSVKIFNLKKFWLYNIQVETTVRYPYTEYYCCAGPQSENVSIIIMIEFEEKGALCAKHDFLSLFSLLPFRASESPRLQTWFISSLVLSFHRSNVRSPGKPTVSSSELPKRDIKWCGSLFAATIIEEVSCQGISCYGSTDANIKFRKCVKCPLFSNPVT